MQCEKCHGLGFYKVWRPEERISVLEQCLDCLEGIASCCEGHEGQAEPEDE